MAKDITLKNKSNGTVLYPKTVSDVVFENGSGHNLKELSLHQVFVGQDFTWVNMNIYGLLPNRRYRLSYENPVWEMPTRESGDSADKLNIRAVNTRGTEYIIHIITTFKGQETEIPVPKDIIFETQDDFQYLIYGGRAAQNVKVPFTITDITFQANANGLPNNISMGYLGNGQIYQTIASAAANLYHNIDYIPVRTGDTYTVNVGYTTSQLCNVNVYDADLRYLNYYNTINLSNGQRTFTLNVQNAAYMRLTITEDSANNAWVRNDTTGEIIWKAETVTEEINERLETAEEEIKKYEVLKLPTIPSQRIRNGSQGNGGNAYTVTLYGVETSTSAIPVQAGHKYMIQTNRPNTEGYKYYYGICTYATLTPTPYLTSQTIRNDMSWPSIGKSIDEPIFIQEGEIGLSVNIAEYNQPFPSSQAASAHPIRMTDFEGDYYLRVVDVTDNIAGENEQSVENRKDIEVICDSIQNNNIPIPREDYIWGYYTITNNSLTWETAMNNLCLKEGRSVHLKEGDVIRANGVRWSAMYMVGTNWNSLNWSRDDFTIDTEADYYLILSKSNGSNIHDKYALIDAFKIERNTATAETVLDIYGRNQDKLPALINACRYHKTSNTSKDFQALICTDMHSWTLANENAVTATNNFATIDCYINCGDIMGGYYNKGEVAAFQQTMKKATKPWYVVAGNHDVGNCYFVGYACTHEQAYEAYTKPMVDDGVLSTGDFRVGKPYWLHDDTNYKIRFIGLYEYDDNLDLNETVWKAISFDSSLPDIKFNTSYAVGDKVNAFKTNYTEYSFEAVQAVTTPANYYTTPQNLPSYKVQRGVRVIREEQANWFLNALATTPSGYGVIVIMHNPFSQTAKSLDCKFSWPANASGAAWSQNSMTTDFIRNALVAYKNKTNYTEKVIMSGNASYLNTLNDGSINYAYEVAKDFSSANGYLLGILGGHSHRDLVWKDSAEDIYQVTPNCAIVDGANDRNGDVRRTRVDGLCADSLTVVSLAEGRIGLVKLGVNVTENGTFRDYEVINTTV